MTNFLRKIFGRKVSIKPPVPLPVTDYTAARDRAVAWLGDRYLLAQPAKLAPPKRRAPLYD